MSLSSDDALSAKSATHPRVTLADLEANAVRVDYLNAGEAVSATGGDTMNRWGPLSLLTLCIVTTKNGFTVVGKSAPASPENFDAEKGRIFAREDALRQLWPLMGYALRERLAVWV